MIVRYKERRVNIGVHKSGSTVADQLRRAVSQDLIHEFAFDENREETHADVWQQIATQRGGGSHLPVNDDEQRMSADWRIY